MARNRQGALGRTRLIQITAGLFWLVILLVLFRKFGGEACEVFLFGSSLVAYLIGYLWKHDIPPQPFDRTLPMSNPEERTNLQDVKPELGSR